MKKTMVTTRRLRMGASCSAIAAGFIGAAMLAPTAGAEPYGDTPAERQYLAEADQYMQRPRPTDVAVLRVGKQACQVRRSGGTSDDAKAEIWKTFDQYGISMSGAEVGSLVHVAVDNLCPEVGYP
jgi:Protein of unknown function (DUF732)